MEVRRSVNAGELSFQLPKGNAVVREGWRLCSLDLSEELCVNKQQVRRGGMWPH